MAAAAAAVAASNVCTKKGIGPILAAIALSWKEAKLYIPSTLNTDYILWHTQLIVCAVKYYIMGYYFQVFGLKKHSKLT